MTYAAPHVLAGRGKKRAGNAPNLTWCILQESIKHNEGLNICEEREKRGGT